MRSFALVILGLARFSQTGLSGQWRTMGDTTLAFAGEITDEDVESLKRLSTVKGFERYGVRHIKGEVDEKSAVQMLGFRRPAYVDNGLDFVEKQSCKADLEKFTAAKSCEERNDFDCTKRNTAHSSQACLAKLGIPPAPQDGHSSLPTPNRPAE